jgi:hypothetical protein
VLKRGTGRPDAGTGSRAAKHESGAGVRRVLARAYYESQCEKGKDHHAATRAPAFKWIRLIFWCWQTRTLYNEDYILDSDH